MNKLSTLKRRFKLSLNLLTPCILAAFANNAFSGEYDTMQKQLNIMSNIIESSVATEGNRKRSKITGIESTYLKGQGVVFTINSSSRSNNWGNYNFNFVMPEMPDIPEISFGSSVEPVIPVAPVAPEPPTSTRYFDTEDALEISEKITSSWEKAADGFERAMDSFRDNRDEFRELRDEQRDLAYQVRDLEREKRDLEYQQRRADNESKQELAKQVQKIEKQRNEIEQARVKLAEKSSKLKQEQQKQKAQQAQERDSYYEKLTLTLAETFCLYGNGLKSVPKNENVSLIVKSAGEKEGRRYKDKIYVFSKKDITDCSSDKITVAKLLAKGKGYLF